MRMICVAAMRLDPEAVEVRLMRSTRISESSFLTDFDALSRRMTFLKLIY